MVGSDLMEKKSMQPMSIQGEQNIFIQGQCE